MSESRSGRIVRELMDKPHIEGRRVDVLTIYDRVEKAGLDPKTVADRLELNVADVYRALTYYYDHREEMEELREEREQAFAEFRETVNAHRPAGLTPPGDSEEEP